MSEKLIWCETFNDDNEGNDDYYNDDDEFMHCHRKSMSIQNFNSI